MLSSISILLKRRRQRKIQEIKAEARKIAAQELGARRSLRRSPRAENPRAWEAGASTEQVAYQRGSCLDFLSCYVMLPA